MAFQQWPVDAGERAGAGQGEEPAEMGQRVHFAPGVCRCSARAPRTRTWPAARTAVARYLDPTRFDDVGCRTLLKMDDGGPSSKHGLALPAARHPATR